MRAGMWASLGLGRKKNDVVLQRLKMSNLAHNSLHPLFSTMQKRLKDGRYLVYWF